MDEEEGGERLSKNPLCWFSAGLYIGCRAKKGVEEVISYAE